MAHADPDHELRQRLEALRGHRTLRELAKELGVSHVGLWKFLRGAELRPTTRRRLIPKVEALTSQGLGDVLTPLVNRVARDIGEDAARRLESAVIRLLRAEYRAHHKTIPQWLQKRLNKLQVRQSRGRRKV
jgi:hypothetical protein